MKNAYKEINDDELIARLRAGDEDVVDHLLDKYRSVVRRKSNAMFLIGGDTDDLNQEGMIGLYKAIRDYDPQKEASFSTFANMCIQRQMYTAVEASQRKKHSPLNSYVSIDEREELENIIALHENSENSNPETMYIDQENAGNIRRKIDELLSVYEKKVLNLYLSGLKADEIASVLEKKQKSVENAIGRIRSKIHEAI